VLQHIGMLARKNPFAARSSLVPTLIGLATVRDSTKWTAPSDPPFQGSKFGRSTMLRP
jgi:hypothetical protein